MNIDSNSISYIVLLLKFTFTENIKPIAKNKKILYNIKNLLIEYTNQKDIHDEIALKKENILSYSFYLIENRKFLHVRFKTLTCIINKNYKNISLYTIKNFVSCQNLYAKIDEVLDL